MTAPDLSAAEREVVDRFEAAEEPAEITREKLRLAEEALARVRALADKLERCPAEYWTDGYRSAAARIRAAAAPSPATTSEGNETR